MVSKKNKQSNFKRISIPKEGFPKSIDYARNSFFIQTKVKQCKNALLKLRLQTLIFDRGLSESKFYKKIGLTKQYWYALSNGIFEPTLEIKIKIARELKTDSSLIFQEGGDSK